jgi:hypothetical protein
MNMCFLFGVRSRAFDLYVQCVYEESVLSNRALRRQVNSKIAEDKLVITIAEADHRVMNLNV